MIWAEKEFSGFHLIQVHAEKADELSGMNVDPGQIIRAELPASPSNLRQMTQNSFFFGDRTIGVSINLKRTTQDYKKLVRFEMKQANHELDDEIYRIALESFPTDRRFHVRPVPDMNIARQILNQWIKELTEVYVCLHKDRIVGFIDLEKTGENERFIHLAAVEEKYRAAGAAMSMYAYAIQQAKEAGCTKISGRISSTNTAVMNLYAYLGGSFQDPFDIYLKEGKP